MPIKELSKREINLLINALRCWQGEITLGELNLYEEAENLAQRLTKEVLDAD